MITRFHVGTAALAIASTLTLGGCGERAAEVRTPTATAEVRTNLPEEQLSQAQLAEAAANAAVAASAPGANTVLPEGTPASNTLIEVSP
jgi:hypothetical protein